MNSNTYLPALYRFCAIWGAHEGSVLLWIFVLSLWSMGVALFSGVLPRELSTRVLGVLGWISVGFLLFLLLTSDPFTRLVPAAIQGRDLNPILQDIGLAMHPPILYFGYVGFSVVFAFAIATLLQGELKREWVPWVRIWTQAAWCFLTLGIVLGSWWSYRELGWGGWWFWDPVENASFLPWLAGTALLHVLPITEKRGLFKGWFLLLAITAFSLSLLGTFIVRSGVLISVHAFAVDPKRGLFLLGFLTAVIAASLALYAWKGRKFHSHGRIVFWSRETMLLINSMFLFVAMLTVLLGTLYPLIVSALGLGVISVGAPYFNTVFSVIMLPAILLMICVSLFLSLQFSVKQLGMFVAHLGVVVTVIGIVFSTTFTQQRKLSVHLGDDIQLGAYHFVFKNITGIKGPNYIGARADMIVRKDHNRIAVLHPQLREYPIQHMAVAKPAINVSIFRDLYVALDAPLRNDAWAFSIADKPFVRWIWAGGLLIFIGGLLGLWNRRRVKS